MERDPELHDLIRRWAPARPTTGLDERMMALYAARHTSFWRRRLELHLAIPAPLGAAAVLVVVLAAAWFFFRPADEWYEPVSAPKLIVTAAGVSQ